MASKLSRDQKRKQKLARRAQGKSSHVSGSDVYRSEKYVKALMHAEIGILEADAILHHEITDRQVAASVRELIDELRSAPERPVVEAAGREITVNTDEPRSLIVWSIERNWQHHFADSPRHSNAELAGILGVILTSIGHWSASGQGPRAYLSYIAVFLGRMGARTVAVPLSEVRGGRR